MPDRLNPTCDRTGEPCPTSPCPGLTDFRACEHWRRLAAWRAVPEDDQRDRTRTALDPRVRDAVIACPDRGSVLPISEQEDCGCRGRELTACRAGRGVAPGKVTLRNCLDCQADRLGRLVPG